MTGVARMTIEKLLRDLGTACAQMQDAAFRDLKSQRIECDEIWAFCGAKEKNASAEKKAQGWGDVWTWTAIDSDSKLILSWLVGKRDAACAHRFMTDVASRLRHRVQLTTDGFKAYFDAVEDAFLGQVDYAILQKIYGTAPTEAGSRYSPAQCMGIKLHVMNGDPDPSLISTSYVERSNLTMRMHMRRFTRLTNGHSKKVENHAHAVALHFAYYNFVKIHQTLRTTPAMAAGVTNRLWEIEDLLALLD
jgi:IS1 family transposase